MSNTPHKISIGDIRRFLQTVFSWYRSGGRPVKKIEQRRRAEICKQCPLNSPSGRKGRCPSCFAKRAFLFAQKHFTSEADHELHYCTVCGCDLKVKTHIPLGVIDNRGIKRKYPSHCWQLDDVDDSQKSVDNEDGKTV